MAELTSYEARPLATTRELELECRLLRAERDAAVAAAARPIPIAAAENKVPWIVAGTLVALFMIISVAWSAIKIWMEAAEKAAMRHHELAMAAVEASPPAREGVDPTNMAVVGAMIALAAILIILGVMRR